ncbi:unnamed protein product [Schistosoma curassoni]|uniref:DUF19 domain-containing protein n=1 Tax=Schistosoma curassoni TaxID=6186 RepID=A0A183KBX4_9TREM|nr:unnamed protein product [Schistosoma curassoni]
MGSSILKEQMACEPIDAKTHVELCTDKLKACKIIYSDAMCKLELLSDSIHTKRLNQNDHSNNEHSHSNNNNNMDDYVMMKSFSKQYESIQYKNECSNNQFVNDNTLNKSNNDCLNVTIVDHLKIDNHNHTTDNDNDNSTVNCFPIMNASISPALSFDTFTTQSLTTTTTSSSSPLSSSSLLFDEQSSTLMLMNSFNNLNLTNNSSHSFISKEICCSNFTITNSS